ncbi:alpha/beta fold hydrolase [Ensifer soli]|uniref:alpha/beta fold hydrolase n=1 Tax=Ciceribacter sp. sgz301302 TaxID=3342379 RepID=UPI0035B8CE6D
MGLMHHTEDGVALSVTEEGDGAPFVFQHGLCGDAAQPGQVFPDGAGFRRVTVECRGHGASEAGPFDRLSIRTFADDIAGYMDASGLAPAVVGGISMGAAIALRLAVTRPELVRALVIARPAWVVDEAPENMRPNLEAGDLITRFPPQEARRRYEASPATARLEEEGPDNLASIRGFFTREPRDVTAALLTRISADGPGVSETEVQAIAVPTLVIGHRLDVVHPLAHAQAIAALIPSARFVEITPKAGDAAAYRADFHAALADFLKGL